MEVDVERELANCEHRVSQVKVEIIFLTTTLEELQLFGATLE